MTPSGLNYQVFLMNYPLSVSNKCPNNVLMKPDIQGAYDLTRAGHQWLSLYRALTAVSVVYVLPGGEYQDLPFVANLACYLPHRTVETIVLANFASQPRRGEEKFGRRFFESFSYQVHQPLDYFEGEADLKWVRDNVYVGGIGRSTRQAYQWMREQFTMDITEVHLTDPKLYHLDCVFLPLGDKALVNTAVMTRYDIRKLEKIVEIVSVPKEYVYEGWTNSIRVGNSLLHSPDKLSVKPFEKLLGKLGLGLHVFDLSEFDKSGADLSCLVMHLNHR